MRYLVKARNDGLIMELIIDDMNTDVVRIGLFGAELWSHIPLTYVQTFPLSDGADLCRHQPEIPPLPCHHAGPCAVIILVWLASDQANCMPCLLIKLSFMQTNA